MRLLLDSGIVGRLCHSSRQINLPLVTRLRAFLNQPDTTRRVFIPAITDYELRRKLLHLIAKQQSTAASLQRLDALAKKFDFLPLDDEMLRVAATTWADARLKGLSTAPPEALDCDVILAAQAKLVDGTVVTTNQKHLSRFVPTIDWTEIPMIV